MHSKQLFPTCRSQYTVENSGSTSISESFPKKWNSLLMQGSLNNHWVSHRICSIRTVFSREQTGWRAPEVNTSGISNSGATGLKMPRIKKSRQNQYRVLTQYSHNRAKQVRSPALRVNRNKIWNHTVVSALWRKKVSEGWELHLEKKC